MNATVSRAEPADAATLALLGRITFAETFGALFRNHPADLQQYLDATFNVAKLERSLGKPENCYWLASLERLPVGYAKLKCRSSLPGQPRQPAAQLQKIYVLEEFLAQRIGRALLAHVLPAAATCAPLIWLDVLRENTRAIRFYRRFGFASVGEDTYTIGVQRFSFHLMTRSVP